MVDESSVCYKHNNRSAAVSCQRCEKPICPSCMNSASVGFHCPDCSKSGSQKVQVGIGRPSSESMMLTFTLLGAIVLAYFYQRTDTGIGGVTDQMRLFGPEVRDGQWWRIFTSAFAHDLRSIMHIGFNGYALYVIGQSLEPSLGKLKFGLIYLGGLLGGALAVLLFNFSSPTIGASGAVLGLIGGLSIFLWSKGINVFQTSLGFIIALNIGLPLLVPSISFWGHLGGLVGGASIAYVLIFLPKLTGGTANSPFGKHTWTAVAIAICVGLFAATYFAGTQGPIVEPNSDVASSFIGV